MVAFVVSTLIGLALYGAIFWVGSKREVDATITWGEAMVAATFAFFLMFWFYGVIPHEWLSWADNELGWRSDKFLNGPGDIFKSTAVGGHLPLTLTYLVVRDIIASTIYVVGLGMQIFAWSWWNKRGQPKDAVVPTSRYGRPLVKTS